MSLCSDDGFYMVGQKMQVCWRLCRVGPSEVASLESSVLWHTEGKGDEDLHVHHFYALESAELDAYCMPNVAASGGTHRGTSLGTAESKTTNAGGDPNDDGPLGVATHATRETTSPGDRDASLIFSDQYEVALPFSPVSYSGQLIQIRWCVRLRLFFADNRQIVRDQYFHLVSCR
ncbi:MAG: hypothetical protein AAFN70_05515 [Planctomycetota bacterium]